MTVPTVALSAPLVTLAHDWTDAVERVVTYPTAVFTRHDGSEQRIAASQTATTRLTYRLIAPDAERAVFLATLGQIATDRLIRLPRWEDQARLAVAVSATATAFTLTDTTSLPTFENGAQVIFWRDPFSYEVLTINTVSGTALTTTAGVASAWGAGTIVCPVEPVRLVEPVSLSHWLATSGALTLTVERLVPDVAGLGTGGTAVTGAPSAITLVRRRIGSLGLLRYARGALEAIVTTAEGDVLTNQAIVWSTSDAVNLGVWPTANPHVAVVANLRPDASLGASATRTATATLGAVSANASIALCW